MATEKPNHLDVLAGNKFGDDKTAWRKIGVAFPLKNRPGFSVRLDFIPAPKKNGYEFIIVEPMPKEEESE